MANKSKKQTASPAENTHKKSFSMLPIHNSFEEGWTVSPALDYVGLHFLEQYQVWETPINRWAIAKLTHQNAQHCGILQSRANMLAHGYLSGGLSKMDFRAMALNLLTFGDVGLLKVRNMFGQVVGLVPLSSLYLRIFSSFNSLRLFDVEKLKQKYSEHAFKQLFMCEWVDDADSIFNISQLFKCAVNVNTWKDFQPTQTRPFGEREVWGGYDPAHSTDGASFVVVAPPRQGKSALTGRGVMRSRLRTL